MKGQNKYTNAFIFGTICAIITRFFINPIYSEVCVVASLVGLVFVLSNLFLLLKTKERIHLFFFPLLFLTWLSYLQPFLSSEKLSHAYRVIPEEFEGIMALSALGGIVFLYLGYYLSFKRKRLKPIFESIKYNSTILQKLTIGLLFVGVTINGLGFLSGFLGLNIDAILSISIYLPTLVLSVSTLYILRGGSNKVLIFFILGYFFINFFIGIANTLFIVILLLIVGPILMYILEKKKIPYIAIALIVIFLLPIYLTKSFYREDAISWWYEGKKMDNIQLFQKGISAFQEIYSNMSLSKYDNIIEEHGDEGVSRFEQLSYFGQAVFQHEFNHKEFYYGKTFYWLPIAVIPRFILPFKPVNDMGTRVAEEYGAKGQGSGAMNFPMLVEYYINFGFLGIVILSYLQGLFCKFCFRKFDYGIGDLNLIALISILLPITRIEGNITLLYGQVLQYMLLWYILSFYLKRRKNAA